MLEILFILGASSGLAAIWTALWKWTRRRPVAAIESDHAGHELVDIRSDVFKPNELVATLCITCDKQLGPEVWQKKLDDELAALDAPADHVDPARRQLSRGELEKLGFRWSGKVKVPGSHNMLAKFICTESRNGKHYVRVILHDKAHLERFLAYKGFGGLWDGELEHRKEYSAADTYVEVRPMIQPIRDPQLESPVDDWSADDYRRRDWTTEILESNYDHSQRKYILPLFQRSRPGRVSRLKFENKAEAAAWWGSCIPYSDFIAGRRTVRRVSGGIRSFSAGGVTETFRDQSEKLSDQLARLTGIPPAIIGKMSAAQASEALNLAQFGVPVQAIWERIPGWTAEDTARARKHMEDEDFDVEVIRSLQSDDPIVVKKTPRGSWG